jgi:superfamily II DNA or RNA helicase
VFYNIKLTIDGNRVYCAGNYPLNVVDLLTSYKVKGYLFSTAYKNKYWDGRKKLFSRATCSFPAGLLDSVVSGLKRYTNNRIDIEIEDKRELDKPLVQNNGYKLHTVNFGEGKYSYQIEAADAAIAAKRGIIKIATNGGKGLISAAIINHLGITVLYVVPGLDLLSQARSDLARYLNIDINTIGQIGDGEFSIGRWITVASVDSLTARFEAKELNRYQKYWNLLISDEVHTSSHARVEAFDFLDCYYRIATSATPLDRTDGANLEIISQFGNIIYDLPNKVLVELGVSAVPSVKIIKIDKPILPEKLSYKKVEKQGIVENDYLNDKMVEEVLTQLDNKKQVVIMIEMLDHGRILLEKFASKNTQHEIVFINGSDKTEERTDVLNKFRKGKIRCIIATNILTCGINLSEIDVLVYGHIGKSQIRVLQRAGRALRKHKGKDSVLLVDFANFTHKYLMKHSLERIRIYREQECFNFIV